MNNFHVHEVFLTHLLKYLRAFLHFSANEQLHYARLQVGQDSVWELFGKSEYHYSIYDTV